MRNTRGSLQLPLALFLLVAAFGAFGTIGLLRHWRAVVRTQLMLDACVGREARRTRAALERVASSALRLKVTRAAIAAALAAGNPVSAVLRSAAEAEATYQRLEQGMWEAGRLHWTSKLGGQGCGGALPLSPGPAFPWRRDPDDPIGPGALHWNGPENRVYRFAVRGRWREAAARIRPSKERSSLAEKWTVEWARIGTGLD